MNRKSFVVASLIVLLALMLNFQPAFAHESFTVGDYEIVYGWVNEPSIAGQLNGIEIFLTNTSTNGPAEEDAVSSLVVDLTYGGQNKTLMLEPGFEEPGAFRATVLPTVPGLYSLKFSGSLGGTL